jgi:hypothetical protein
MIQGKCLCGKVTVEIPEAPETFGACHCLSCRTWTGGVFMSIDPGKHFSLMGDSFVSRYSSSEWAERGFCKECGTHLFFRMKKSDHYFFMLGLFGDQIAPVFGEQQYIDEKPKAYNFEEKTKVVTKSEMNQMLEAFLSKPSL